MVIDFEMLARRAVACKRWSWAPGMFTDSNQRIVRMYKGVWLGYQSYHNEVTEVAPDAIPDLSDPATLGCLLALVREQWGDGVHLIPDGGWYVKGARLKNGSTINLGICTKTEAEALVAALECAL